MELDKYGLYLIKLERLRMKQKETEIKFNQRHASISRYEYIAPNGISEEDQKLLEGVTDEQIKEMKAEIK